MWTRINLVMTLEIQTHYKWQGLTELIGFFLTNTPQLDSLSDGSPVLWSNQSSAKEGLGGVPAVLLLTWEDPGFSSKWALRTWALGSRWLPCREYEGLTFGMIHLSEGNCWPSRYWDWIFHLPTLVICSSDWLLALKISENTIFLETVCVTQRRSKLKCYNVITDLSGLRTRKLVNKADCDDARTWPRRRREGSLMLDVIAPTTCNKLTPVSTTGKQPSTPPWPVRSVGEPLVGFTSNLYVGRRTGWGLVGNTRYYR